MTLQKRSKKSEECFSGRTDTNKVVSFPNVPVASSLKSDDKINLKRGDYVVVRVDEPYPHSLRGTPLARTTLSEYLSLGKSITPLGGNSHVAPGNQVQA